MDREAIETKARAIVVETLGVDEDRVKREANLRNDLDADSLDRIGLVMDVEDDFGISITDDEADGVKTFGDICDLIAERLRD